MAMRSMALMCDRYAISDRSAAAVASAALHDVGMVSADKTGIIDRNKVWRSRSRNREELQKSRSDVLHGLYFDGRKDKTLKIEVDDHGVSHRRSVVEEHVCIIAEPGSQYFCHVSPAAGTARSIANSIISVVHDRGTDTSLITAVGCDGTVVNTGHAGGVIRLLELEFGRPLQWFGMSTPRKRITPAASF